MFLKFICKAFFAKNIVKSVRNGGINGRSSLPVLFPGQSTTFRQNERPFSGKPGGPTGTNATGKNDLLRGQNKAERNCRHAQGTQQIKSRSCRTVFLCGSFCFSVLICTPNTGCPVLGVHIRKTNKSALHFINEVAGKSRLYIIFLLLVQMVLGISSVFYAMLLRGLIDGAVAHDSKKMLTFCVLFVALVVGQIALRAVLRRIR